MLAVFERIGVGTLEALLGAAVRDSALQLVRFENQPPNPRGPSVPDASISARFTYYFEVKTERGALTKKQLRDHLKVLEGSRSDRLLPKQGALQYRRSARAVVERGPSTPTLKSARRFNAHG